MTTHLKLALIGLGTLFLIACGGGSSSSDGGSSSAEDTTPSLDGTYVGSYVATFTVQDRPDLTPTTEVISLTAVITGRNIVVTETDSDFFTAPGVLDDNNRFNVTSGPGISLTDGSLVCSGELTFSGTAVDTSINGASFALFQCSQSGITLGIVSEGEFVLNRSNAKLRSSASIESAIKRLLAL